MKKKKIIFIIMIIILFIIPIHVLAFDLQANVNEPSSQEGKIQIILKLSDLQEYSNGINAVSGKLIYDTSLFESVTFVGMNNWSCAYNNEEDNENNGSFMLITTSGNVNKDTEVAQIELKLKNSIEKQNTKVKIENIQTSYKAQKIESEDKEINLLIENNNITVTNDSSENQEVQQKTQENVQQEEEQNNEYNYRKYIIIILFVIILIILIILIIQLIERRKKSEK